MLSVIMRNDVVLSVVAQGRLLGAYSQKFHKCVPKKDLEIIRYKFSWNFFPSSFLTKYSR
jgi:hypothetical protein